GGGAGGRGRGGGGGGGGGEGGGGAHKIGRVEFLNSLTDGWRKEIALCQPQLVLVVMLVLGPGSGVRLGEFQLHPASHAGVKKVAQVNVREGLVATVLLR